MEESDDVQDARRREKERLERLEKLRQNTVITFKLNLKFSIFQTTTAASYESVPNTSNQNRLLNFVGTGSEQNEEMTDQCVLIRRPTQESEKNGKWIREKSYYASRLT